MDERQKGIAKAVLQMAYADGEVVPSEREVLDKLLFEIGGTPEELQGAEWEAVPNLDELVPEHTERLGVMRYILQMCLADGVLSFSEFDYLITMADKLGISQEEMEKLRKEVSPDEDA